MYMLLLSHFLTLLARRASFLCDLRHITDVTDLNIQTHIVDILTNFLLEVNNIFCYYYAIILFANLI